MKIFRLLRSLAFTAALATAAMPSVAQHSLNEGDQAPLVSARDQDGNKWSLKSHIGKQVVLLYFYPKDDTKGCTAEACGFRDEMDNLRSRNVQVVGVSFDNAESHQKFAFKYNLNFPLLVDTKGKIADAYGVRWGEHRDMDRRVSFLIGADGRIVHITDSPDPAVHLHEMRAAILHLQGKTFP